MGLDPLTVLLSADFKCGIGELLFMGFLRRLIAGRENQQADSNNYGAEAHPDIAGNQWLDECQSLFGEIWVKLKVQLDNLARPGELAFMGNRLSKIYTKTGDAGTTGLGDGERIGKTDPRVEAMGDVDELNSALGVLLSVLDDEQMKNQLLQIQHDLFDLGGELSIPGSSLVPADAVDRIEGLIDIYNEPLPALKEFILPGGSRGAAHCHLARAVCRRAERRAVALSLASEVGPVSLKYLNRLSDLLFVLARVISRLDGGQEINWDRSRFNSQEN